MNSNSKPAFFSSSIRNPQSPFPNPKCSSRLSPSSTSRALSSPLHLSPNLLRARRHAAFTLVELLVVISIIGLLAGLAVPAINGALKSAKKSEVAAVAQSIRTAVLAFNSEYGTWPTNAATFTADVNFLNLMTTTTNSNNIRGIIFLEVPGKFTNSFGIVTPPGYLTGNARSNFVVAVDLDGDGMVTATNGTTATNLRTAVAVWAPDNTKPNQSVGTWK